MVRRRDAKERQKKSDVKPRARLDTAPGQGPWCSRRFTSVCEQIDEHPCPAQPFGGEAA